MKTCLETRLSPDHPFPATEINNTASGKMSSEGFKSQIVEMICALKK